MACQQQPGPAGGGGGHAGNSPGGKPGGKSAQPATPQGASDNNRSTVVRSPGPESPATPSRGAPGIGHPGRPPPPPAAAAVLSKSSYLPLGHSSRPEPSAAESLSPLPPGDATPSRHSPESFSSLPYQPRSNLTGSDGLEEAMSREPSHGQSVYHVKWLQWKEQLTPIVTQNENGPCPLLAIINVLLLAWKVKLPPSMEIVTSEQLMEYLGDSGYALRPWLLTPILYPKSAAEWRYNNAHIATRNTIECTFGVLKRRFRFLHGTGGNLMYSPQKVWHIVAMCVVLHNIARMRKVAEHDENFEIPQAIAEDTAEICSHAEASLGDSGVSNRQTVVQNVFNAD